MSKTIIGYIRVSTDEQGKSGIGLEAQRNAIQRWADDKGYELLHIFEEVISGGKPLNERPVLVSALKIAAKAKATIVVSRLDRLSRDAVVLMTLRKSSTPFIALNLGEEVDMFMFDIFAVFAEQERRVIGQRTKEAMAVCIAQGKKPGNPNKVDRIDENGNLVMGIPTQTAFARAKQCEKADRFANEMKPAVKRMRDTGMPLMAIADEFNRMGTPSARGGKWTAKSVSNLIARWA